MAGGKETPRQKMIGMMYLVLTALLALQVSNAVLEKFIFIDATLNDLKVEKNAKSVSSLDAIKQEYEKKQDPKLKGLYTDVVSLREGTTNLLDDMASLRAKMAEITGGYENEENKTGLVGAKDYDKVGSMMMTGDEGRNLEKWLDDYVANLNALIKKHDLGLDDFSKLTKPASEIQMFKDNPDQKNKSFLEITFMNTPTAAGMASMSHLSTEVLEYEAKLLEAAAIKVGAEIITINTIVPMVKPKSEIVSVGGTYTADLFIAASNSNMSPVMRVNGKEVKVEQDATGIKMGKVSLPASSPGEKSFTAEITMNDTTFTETIKYEVIAPTVNVIRGGLDALYQNCANALIVSCPNCGTDYNPGITASGAKVMKGSKVGHVEIAPTSRNPVNMVVTNSGARIHTQRFSVKPIPSPTVQIMTGGQRADNRDFVPLSAARNIVVRPVADENFAKEVPRDAQYRVVSGKVIHSGGVQTFTGSSVSINGLRPGPVVVQIDKIVRRRYDGSTENVTLNSKNVAFTVR